MYIPDCDVEYLIDFLSIMLGQCFHVVIIRSVFTDLDHFLEHLIKKMDFLEVSGSGFLCNQGVKFPALKFMGFEVVSKEETRERECKIFHQ